MSDLEKSRTQLDAQRNVAGRRYGGSRTPEQAIVRQLGVELYRSRHQTDQAPEQPIPEHTESEESDESDGQSGELEPGR